LRGQGPRGIKSFSYSERVVIFPFTSRASRVVV
jgi:hypothetical protein